MNTLHLSPDTTMIDCELVFLTIINLIMVCTCCLTSRVVPDFGSSNLESGVFFLEIWLPPNFYPDLADTSASAICSVNYV